MKRWGKRVTALCLTAGMVMLTGCSAAQPEKADNGGYGSASHRERVG